MTPTGLLMEGHSAQNPKASGAMHYERAPRFRRSKLDAAPPPLRYAVQGFAPLRRLENQGAW
ncbi:MAG: hypothetical protein ACLP3R_18300, partial [Candidatus Korobacteraceae bacterium]